MPLDLNTSIADLKKRVDKTLSVQSAIQADWIWPLKSIAQWQTDSLQLDQTQANTLAANAVEANTIADVARGRLEARLTLMHRQTVAVVGVMRVRAERNEELRAVVNDLSARGDGRKGIEDEGAALLSAWKLEFGGAAFVPAPGITFAAFQKLFYGDAQANPALASLRELKEVLSDASTLERKAVGRVNVLLNRAQDDCVDWYAEATKVYPVGTENGDLIRTEVPTSYTGGSGSGSGGSGGNGSGNGGSNGGGTPLPTVPAKAQITNLTGSGTATVEFDMTAEGATLFDVYVKVPASNDFELIAEDLTEPHYTIPNVSGAPWFVKVVGKNAQGSGQESDEVNFSGPA